MLAARKLSSAIRQERQYRVNSPDGLHEVVSLLPPEQVTNEGLCAQAIIGSYAGIVEERDLVVRRRQRNSTRQTPPDTCSWA